MQKIYFISFLLMILGTPVQAETQPSNAFNFFINPITGPEETIIEIYLVNESNQPLEFEAATSQWFDFWITNQKKEIVYQYSNGRSFLQAFQKIILQPGDTKKWSVNIKEPYGKVLEPGKYFVDAKFKGITVNGKDIMGYHNLTDQKEMVVPPQNPIIRNVMARLNGDSLEISGKARVKQRKLYYCIEDGHQERVSETSVKVNNKHSEWGDFLFNIDLPKKEESLILYLYVKDKNGRLQHIYPKRIK